MAAPAQKKTPPEPADLVASRRWGLPRDAFIPGTGLTWEGAARMTGARIAAGLPLTEQDVTALGKAPDAALTARLNPPVEVPAVPREAEGDYANPREVDPVTAKLVDKARAIASRAAADAAIAEADANANPDWRAAVAAVIVALAAERETFTTDDVWRFLDADHAEAITHEPRALGALMLAAARDGVIATLDDWRPSDRIVNHGRPVRVWRSLIIESVDA
jgi:hypothetical protein